MRVRWATKAADDLAHIVEYIRKDNSAVARRVAKTIYQGIAGLRQFPNIGRIGLAENTRERRGPISASMKSSTTRCTCFAFVMPRRTGRNSARQQRG
jgi:plasmid stabilization system protein ParE